jgi:hypothetical protein
MFSLASSLPGASPAVFPDSTVAIVATQIAMLGIMLITAAVAALVGSRRPD